MTLNYWNKKLFGKVATDVSFFRPKSEKEKKKSERVYFSVYFSDYFSVY